MTLLPIMGWRFYNLIHKFIKRNINCCPPYNSIFCSVWTVWCSSSLPLLNAVAAAAPTVVPLRRDALSRWLLTIESANFSHCVGSERTIPSCRGDGGGIWNKGLLESSTLSSGSPASTMASPKTLESEAVAVVMPLGSIMLGIVLEVIWSALSLFVSIVWLSLMWLMMLLVILHHYNTHQRESYCLVAWQGLRDSHLIHI